MPAAAPDPRYHRQMLLPDIGPDGQARLGSARVLIVGAGALGCTVADWLVRAGVGHVGIVDRDLVEATNLQRQTLYTERDVGAPKASAAAERLRAVNSLITIEPIVADLNPRSVERLIRGVGGRGGEQAVIDCTDNFQTRYLLNDACVKLAVPLVYGGVVGTGGMLMNILPPAPQANRTPCLRCVFPDPPPPGATPTCDTAGVLGPMVGIVASHQATEAIKILLARFDLVDRSLRQLDAWHNVHRSIKLAAPEPECPCCGKRQFDFLEGDRADAGEITLCGSNAIQLLPTQDGVRLDLHAVLSRLSSQGEFAATPHFVRGTLAHERNGSLELTVFADGRAIVKGTTDLTVARGVYAKYVGA